MRVRIRDWYRRGWEFIQFVPEGPRDQVYRALLLNFTLLLLLVLALASSLLSLAALSFNFVALDQGTVIGAGVSLAATLVFALLFWFNRRGYTGRIAWILLITITVLIGFSDEPVEIMQGRSLLFFAIPTVLASPLLGANLGWWITFFVIIMLAVVSRAGQVEFNLLAPFGILGIQVFVWLITLIQENSLREVEAARTRLEERVEERTAELNEANIRLEEADKLKNKFISDISRTFNTPISNIIIHIEMLANHIHRSTRIDNIMNVIVKESFRLDNLVKNSLDLSKLDNEEGPMQMERVNVRDIVQEAVEDQQMFAQARDLQLTIHSSDLLPSIWGNSEKIYNAITTLIDNSLKYTRKGLVQVTAFHRIETDEVCLEVQDTGVGIDPEDEKHIFERFYRGRKAMQSDVPGAGLGLAIVKETMEAHDGRVEVVSQIGMGTKFIISFPVPAKK